jgi:hypothetical protein
VSDGEVHPRCLTSRKPSCPGMVLSRGPIRMRRPLIQFLSNRSDCEATRGSHDRFRLRIR